MHSGVGEWRRPLLIEDCKRKDRVLGEKIEF